MANFNKVILAGNLTRDPQLKYLPSNTAVAEFGLAINRKWRAQDGTMKEDTCFVDCSCFGKGAEILNQYMKKGRGLMVEGRLKFDQWESKEGQKRSRLSVVVENFQFLGERGGQREGGGDYGSAPAARVPAAVGGASDYSDAPPPSDDFAQPGGESVPF